MKGKRNSKYGLFTPNDAFMQKTSLNFKQCAVSGIGIAFLLLCCNVTMAPITIYKDSQISELQDLEIVGVENDLGAVTAVYVTGAVEENIKKLTQENLDADITLEQKQELIQLLLNFADVCSTGSSDIGQTHLVKHKIDTQGNPPIKLRPY